MSRNSKYFFIVPFGIFITGLTFLKKEHVSKQIESTTLVTDLYGIKQKTSPDPRIPFLNLQRIKLMDKSESMNTRVCCLPLVNEKGALDIAESCLIL
jgi:hypothetical protein